MTRNAAAAVVAAVALGAWPTGRSGAQERQPFLLAVDEGTTLFPIARYDGHRWMNTWPPPQDIDTPVPALRAVPRSWLGRTVPLDWTVWFTTGGSAAIHVSGLERSGGCEASPKLTIGSRPRAPSALYDVVHVGLATTDGVPVEAVRRLRDTDGEWRNLRPRIERIFLAAERRAVDGYPGDEADMREKLSARRMANVPVTLDWLYASTGAGARVYYFEAAKRAAGASLRIGVSGWLVEGANGRLQAVDVKGWPRWDEDVPRSPISDVSDQIPLGILRVAGRALWIVEIPTGETGSFTVYDVAATGVRALVTTDAGGC